MAAIQIKKDRTDSYPNLGNTYRLLELESDKCSMVVMFVTGKQTYVQVIVQNASHQAWKKFGRQFATIDAAIGHYKSAPVKSLLEAAKAL